MRLRIAPTQDRVGDAEATTHATTEATATEGEEEGSVLEAASDQLAAEVFLLLLILRVPQDAGHSLEECNAFKSVIEELKECGPPPRRNEDGHGDPSGQPGKNSALGRQTVMPLE